MKQTLFLIGAAGLVLALPATAQEVPDDLTVMPPVSDAYQPSLTSWGVPDLRGSWPINDIADLPVNRPAQYGDRFWKTDEEMAAEQGKVEALEEAYEVEDEQSTIGLGHWIEFEAGVRRTSAVVSPSDGRLPEWTDEGRRRSALMRSSWLIGQTYDWTDDFDTYDRCITRGFPAAMYPARYNNGLRIFQSPGQVAIVIEMLGTRVIPVGEGGHWPEAVTGWYGSSRGRWVDHNTLEVETTNLTTGASVFSNGTLGVPRNNTTPVSEQAKVVERFTMVGPDTITYEMTYEDPVVWTAPFTLRVNWTRDDDYQMFEYACHEGNVQLRGYINSDRARREQEYARGQMLEPVGDDAGPPPAMDPAAGGLKRRED
tara:strand:+ start:59919 stop:61028 length:1110 start_codon:yes stop_codon:yes gene_type:complete